MDLLNLQRRTGAEVVESWDDDEDLQGTLELKSSALSVTGTRSRTDRESMSSRMSFKSDGDFDFDDDHEQVLLAPQGNSALAIESAKRAGIPLPQHIPSSALMGGTIKRLGSTKPKLISHDDWSDDLELPTSGGLAVKTAQFTDDFPTDMPMRYSPPAKEPRGMDRMLASITPAAAQLSSHLSKYQETDDDDWDGEDIPTLRVPLKPNARKTFGGLLSPPLSASKESPNEEEAFDTDFVLPEGGLQLQLKHDQNRSSPAVLTDDDFEEWAEGERPQRNIHRARSTRSSSVSLMSPTLSSANTFDSEDDLDDDEGFDGLQLPEGPIDFEEILEKRKQNDTPEPSIDFELHRKATKEDFLSGLEIGDGDIFDPSKLTLNRNVKHKTTRQASPTRRAAVALTFTNQPPTDAVKTTSTVPTRQSRIPRLHGIHPPQGPSMDAAAEARQRKADQRARYSASPVMDHNAFGQMGSFFHPHPTPPPSVQSGAARPRIRPSVQNLPQKQQSQQPPTTTSAQLLRLKRSIPTIPRQTTNPPSRTGRPPSRSETPNALSVLNAIRPTTPSDRKESTPPPVRRPFIPGGSSVNSSHNVNVKSSNRYSYRGAVEDTRPTSRLSNSRTARDTPPPPPSTKATAKIVPPLSRRKEVKEVKDTAASRLITKPTTKRNFGDGTELDLLDDLPTSQKAEEKFVKAPVGKGAPRALRSRSIPIATPPPPGTPPVVVRETTPSKTPNFAKDTNGMTCYRARFITFNSNPNSYFILQFTDSSLCNTASRTAREQRIAALASSSAASHWKNMIAARGSPKSRSTTKKAPQQRPHLIKPMGNQSSIPKGT